MAWWRWVCMLPLILAACGAAKQERSVRLLDRRLHRTLASDIAVGKAVVQRVPGGVRVTLLTPGQMPDDEVAASNRDYDARASVIEALLDHRMMRVQVTDTGGTPTDWQGARVRDTEVYFAAFDLANVLEPAATPAGGPAGLAMTIHVICPSWPHSWTDSDWGYGSGRSGPECE